MKAVLAVTLAFFALGSCMSPPVLTRKCGCAPSDEKACGQMPDGEYKLFDSSCQARCADATVVKPLYCYGTGLLPVIPPVHRLCGCQRIGDPVCARKPDGSLADFANKCEAGCHDAVTVHHGRCDSHDPEPAHVKLCGCPPVDEPVCAILPGGVPTSFRNKCEAGCADQMVMYEGKCH